MKNIRIFLLSIMLLFMNFRAFCPIHEQNIYSSDNSYTIKISDNDMECKTVLVINGKTHIKIHKMELSEITKFGFVSKAGQRIEIKVFNYY